MVVVTVAVVKGALVMEVGEEMALGKAAVQMVVALQVGVMALAAWASEVAEGVVAGAGEVASGVAAATEAAAVVAASAGAAVVMETGVSTLEHCYTHPAARCCKGLPWQRADLAASTTHRRCNTRCMGRG